MRFSVIIPVYNVEPYLRQCLDSILGQTYGDWEAICVNDGSTDGSADILSGYASRDSRISVITQANNGLSAARNVGVRAAKGDRLLFLDSDDWLDVNTLSRLETVVDNTDMVCFGCRRTDSGYTDALPLEQTDGWTYYNRHALEHRVTPFVCVVQRCYRRELLTDNLFREGILHEDNYFTPLICLKARRVRVIPDILYNYRIRPDSIMTTRGLRSKKSLILIANELSELFSHEGNIDRTVIYRSLTQHYQMAFINNTREEDRLLLPLVDRHAYRRVSRTKLRHRLNHAAMSLSPSLFRFLNQ